MRRPISSSKLEAYNLCPLLFYFTYISGPKKQKNAEFTFGDVMHRVLESVYDLKYKSPFSVSSRFVQMWRDELEIDEEKGKFGVWFPIEGRNADFYEKYGSNFLRLFYMKNENQIQRVREEREQVRKMAKDKVIAEYLAQHPLSTITRDKKTKEDLQKPFVRITKKLIEKETRKRIKEVQKEEINSLFPRLEQTINFEWKGFYLMTKPDFLTKRKDGQMIYVDYKIYWDLMEHQFTMAKLGIKDKYKTDNIRMIMYHIINRYGASRQKHEDKILNDGHFEKLEYDLGQLTRFLEKTSNAIKTYRKFKKGQFENKSYVNSDLESIRKTLDIMNFPCRTNKFCTICDYHRHCDNLKKDTRQKDLDMIVHDYWENAEPLVDDYLVL